MPTKTPRIMIEMRYYEAAQEFLRSLPLEHFMQATPQATQRKITLESLDLVAARREDFHLFNELLVQYPRPGQKRPGQVVPDNMVVIHDGPIKAEGSYDVPLQPARPFWTLEYVSKSNRRKDYDDNMQKYEHELKVPYYLLFVPDEQEMTLYRHKDGRYASVRPNKQGRCEIKELGLAVAILDGWVRFWHEGELLPLPAELQKSLDETRQQLANATRRADKEALRAAKEALRADEQTRRAEAAEREAARLQAQLAAMQPRPRSNP